MAMDGVALSSYAEGMTSPLVDGVLPRRAVGASPTSSDTSGSRLRASASSDASQRAEQFELQLQQSMMSSLGAIDAPEDVEGSNGDDGGPDPLAGIASMYQLDLLDGLLQSARRSGLDAAQVQALMATVAGASVTGAGAGDEAKLAQQLLSTLGSVDARAAAGVSSAPVDRGAAANAGVVASVAREQGVDPVVAVAMMLVESGGRSGAVGDGGTSFGLFQLHEGGMLTAAGLTSTQAFDPRTNATVALRSLAHEWAKGHERRTPGEIAAASQRPADPTGYAARVDGAMDRARMLLADARRA